MAERVGEPGDAAPGVVGDVGLEDRPGHDAAVARGRQIVDDKVEVDRRPVAVVAALAVLGPGGLLEQVDRRAAAQQLEPDRSEPAADGEAERLG